jgi:hypothetical protein
VRRFVVSSASARDSPLPSPVRSVKTDEHTGRRSRARRWSPNNGLYPAGGVFGGAVQKFGAVTLFPSTVDIVGAVIRDREISDSTYDGLQLKNGGGNMPNVSVSNTKIDRSPIRAPATS